MTTRADGREVVNNEHIMNWETDRDSERVTPRTRQKQTTEPQNWNARDIYIRHTIYVLYIITYVKKFKHSIKSKSPVKIEYMVSPIAREHCSFGYVTSQS